MASSTCLFTGASFAIGVSPRASYPSIPRNDGVPGCSGSPRRKWWCIDRRLSRRIFPAEARRGAALSPLTRSHPLADSLGRSHFRAWDRGLLSGRRRRFTGAPVACRVRRILCVGVEGAMRIRWPHAFRGSSVLGPSDRGGRRGRQHRPARHLAELPWLCQRPPVARSRRAALAPGEGSIPRVRGHVENLCPEGGWCRSLLVESRPSRAAKRS